MKNPFKSFLVFVIIILLMAFLGSCTTQKRGFDYKGHQKKSESLVKKTNRLNKGRDLTHRQCTNRH